MDKWSEPPGGFTPAERLERRRRRIHAQIAIVVATTLFGGGVAGYRWATSVTAVDRSWAVELFRAGRNAPSEQAAEGVRRDASAAKDRNRVTTRSGPDARERRVVPSRQTGASGQENDSSQPSGTTPEHRSRDDQVDPPREGVYSWRTEGYEQVGGARREFPEETQRIITLVGGSWKQHHYFSEERQIWTLFQPSSRGVEIVEQRNKVTFGPVTRESEIDFRPPMLAAPAELRVGYRWDGEWDGDTYGSYSGTIFERTAMNVGGERVEVWGMTYVIDLRGEQEGRVNARVWFAPDPGLTVKEHYVQDVESGGADYHAEWLQTLKSLEPRQ